ncbi:alpha/beta hydrolase family protein [Nocardia sp. NPDC060220]|uniref:alpha/beta hydrolase family protein n=1 Tax=Nocardia sp. NPDC060220 TaxID=3347076 RepID=UPI0036467268
MHTKWLTIPAVVIALTSPALPVAAAPTDTGNVEAVEALSDVATLPGSVDPARIIYTTTTAGGAPATSSAAVYFPSGSPPPGGWPIIAWAHGTIGLADRCAYSVAGPGSPQRDWEYLGTWLRQGYAVVATDYAGLGTPGQQPYLNGAVEAANIVDGVKAVTRHFRTVSNKWVVVGQSQGGEAAMFTARYATELGGAELDYRGAVGTGVPAYNEELIATVGPGFPPMKISTYNTQAILYILNGLQTSHPDVDIDSYLTDSGRHWFSRAQQICQRQFHGELAVANVVIGDLLARPLRDLPEGLLRNYLALPETGFDKPVFIGQGLRDTNIITPNTLRYAATLTAAGQPVRLHTYPTDHSATVNASLVDSVPFVAAAVS